MVIHYTIDCIVMDFNNKIITSLLIASQVIGIQINSHFDQIRQCDYLVQFISTLPSVLCTGYSAPA